MPDYANIRKGYAKPQEQSTGIPFNSEQVNIVKKNKMNIKSEIIIFLKIIRLNNERFTIPELLFHPSDIGINEMGIPEAIVDSIEACSNGTILRIN